MSEGRILVVDDNEPMLARIRATLSAVGYEVVTSSQPVGNARHLKSCDLVILDFHMPGIDGGEVLASMRAATAASETTCLFYLYTSDERLADDFARLGFDGSFTHKGDEKALVPQVKAVFRLLKLRALGARGKGPPSSRSKLPGS